MYQQPNQYNGSHQVPYGQQVNYAGNQFGYNMGQNLNQVNYSQNSPYINPMYSQTAPMAANQIKMQQNSNIGNLSQGISLSIKK